MAFITSTADLSRRSGNPINFESKFENLQSSLTWNQTPPAVDFFPDSGATGFTVNQDKIPSDKRSQFITIEGNRYTISTAIDVTKKGILTSAEGLKRQLLLANGSTGQTSYGTSKSYFGSPLFGNTGFHEDNRYEDSSKLQILKSAGPGGIGQIGFIANRYRVLNSPSLLEQQYSKLNLQDESVNYSYIRQPFILRGIQRKEKFEPQRWGVDALTNLDDGLIRGGATTAAERSAIDVARIGKWLASPKGILWTAKQVGLGLSNPKVESIGGPFTRLTRIHSGVASLASVATTAFGIHVTRHGIPFANEQADYENVQNAKIGNWGDNLFYANRLVKLRDQLFESTTMKSDSLYRGLGPPARVRVSNPFSVTKFSTGTPIGQEIRLLSGLAGPQSVYGIGNTGITRAVDTRTKASEIAQGQLFLPPYTINRQYASKLGASMLSNATADEDIDNPRNSSEVDSSDTSLKKHYEFVIDEKYDLNGPQFKLNNYPANRKLFNDTKEPNGFFRYFSKYNIRNQYASILGALNLQGSTFDKEVLQSDEDDVDDRDEPIDTGGTIKRLSLKKLREYRNKEYETDEPFKINSEADNNALDIAALNYGVTQDYGYTNQYASLLSGNGDSTEDVMSAGQRKVDNYGLDPALDEKVVSLRTAITKLVDPAQGGDESFTPGIQTSVADSRLKIATQRLRDQGKTKNEDEDGTAPIRNYMTMTYGQLRAAAKDRSSTSNTPNDFRAKVYENASAPAETVALGLPWDFTKNTPKLDYFTSHNLDKRYGFGNPGKVGADRRNPYEILPAKFDRGSASTRDSLFTGPNNDIFRGDRVNAIDIASNVPRANIYPDGAKDLIEFYFENGEKWTDPNSPATDLIIFRATITGFTDNFSAGWNRVEIMGRPDGAYLYNSFDRNISFSFTVAATSRSEMIPIWRKLNYLASNCAPDYSGTRSSGPFMRITLGNLFQQTPGFFDSITYTVPEDAIWDIAEDLDIDPIQTAKQLPTIVEVSINMTIVGDFRAQQMGRMYSLAPKGIKGGKGDWLSDFNSTIPLTIGEDPANPFGQMTPPVPETTPVSNIDALGTPSLTPLSSAGTGKSISTSAVGTGGQVSPVLIDPGPSSTPAINTPATTPINNGSVTSLPAQTIVTNSPPPTVVGSNASSATSTNLVETPPPLGQTTSNIETAGNSSTSVVAQQSDQGGTVINLVTGQAVTNPEELARIQKEFQEGRARNARYSTELNEFRIKLEAEGKLKQSTPTTSYKNRKENGIYGGTFRTQKRAQRTARFKSFFKDLF